MQKLVRYGLWASSALALAITLMACGTNGSTNRCTTNNDCEGDRICTADGRCSSMGQSVMSGPDSSSVGEDYGPTPTPGGESGGGGGVNCAAICAHLDALCEQDPAESAACPQSCAETGIPQSIASCIMNATSCFEIIACGELEEWNNEEWNNEEWNNWSNNEWNNTTVDPNPGEPTDPPEPTEPTEPTGNLNLCEVFECYGYCGESDACFDECENEASPTARQQISTLEACYGECASSSAFLDCLESVCPTEFAAAQACG